MVGWSALSGCTSWIIWMRRPRLNNAVATVAVETDLSLLRVASLSLVISYSLVNRGLADRRAEIGLEEVEVAAVIGLLDVLGEHPAIAALEAALGLLPGGAALVELGLRHIKIDGAGSDIERDAVAVPHQRQRSADIRLRSDVQNAGAVAGAAHARIGDAHHVADALLHELGRDRQHAPFRHARSALRAGVAQDQDMIGRDVEIGIVDRLLHRRIIVEHQRRAGMPQEARLARRGLDDAAVGRE